MPPQESEHLTAPLMHLLSTFPTPNLGVLAAICLILPHG